MSKPKILELEDEFKELKDRVHNKHTLFSGALFDSTGSGVETDLSGNASDYNFFIARIRKWNGNEQTTVVIPTLDTFQYFIFPSLSNAYKAYFAIAISSDNKLKFQMGTIQGWDSNPNQIQVEEVWGI